MQLSLMRPVPEIMSARQSVADKQVFSDMGQCHLGAVLFYLSKINLL